MYEFLDWTVQDAMSRPVTLGPNATLAEGYGGAISPMPPMGGILPDDDLRDLVAFLAELNAESGR